MSFFSNWFKKPEIKVETRGKYVRTPEIREKQRLAMLGKNKKASK
jgi:hypothetical protein